MHIFATISLSLALSLSFDHWFHFMSFYILFTFLHLNITCVFAHYTRHFKFFSCIFFAYLHHFAFVYTSFLDLCSLCTIFEPHALFCLSNVLVLHVIEVIRLDYHICFLSFCFFFFLNFASVFVHSAPRDSQFAPFCVWWCWISLCVFYFFHLLLLPFCLCVCPWTWCMFWIPSRTECVSPGFLQPLCFACIALAARRGVPPCFPSACGERLLVSASQSHFPWQKAAALLHF